MTRSLSDYFLRNASIDLNIARTLHNRCTKRVAISYCVEECHITLFHIQPPQTSTPALHTKTNVQLLFHNLFVHHGHVLHKLHKAHQTS